MSGMLIEQTDVLIDGVEGFTASGIEAFGPLPHEGKEKEQSEKTSHDAMPIGRAKEEESEDKDEKIACCDYPKGGSEQRSARDEEDNEGCPPQEKMGEHVHQGVERYAGNGTRHADETAQLHDAIRGASRAKGGGVGKGEA